MPNPSIHRLLKKTGNENLLHDLNKLSLSELNSLLLDLFRQRAGRLSIKSLLQAYHQNRFVRPSTVNPLSFLMTELMLMELASKHGFTLMELSPLAPLGSCSVMATVDQNKVVSALRGTEVVADATNVLAMEAATQRLASNFSTAVDHYCASHRHVRAQSLSGKGFTAHFKIFCAVSSGKDTGNFTFEKTSLLKHLSFYHDFFKQMNLKEVKFIIKELKEKGTKNLLVESLQDDLKNHLNDVALSFIEVPQKDHSYYSSVRFSMNVVHQGKEHNIGDGGFVNWAEKLTGNKKERMLTSGIGTELLLKLINNLL